MYQSAAKKLFYCKNANSGVRTYARGFPEFISAIFSLKKDSSSTAGYKRNTKIHHVDVHDVPDVLELPFFNEKMPEIDSRDPLT